MNALQKMVKKIVYSLFIILLLNQTSAFSQTDTYGEKLLKMNQFKTAKSYFLKKNAEKPNDISTLYFLGETYYNLGILDTAEFYFQKGIVLNPNDIYTNIGMGKILLDKSNIPEAKKCLKRQMHWLNIKT